MIAKGQGGTSVPEAGYAMAALLVAIAVMTLVMSAAVPAWRTMTQRDREAELIFRGEQYARAIVLFQRKAGGALPPNIQVLIEQRMLRRKYRDPMTRDGEFQVLYQGLASGPGQGGAEGTRLPGQRGGQGPPGGALPPVGGPGAPASPPAPGAGAGAQPGAFGSVGPGGAQNVRGGVVIGVVSRSKGKALRRYQGRDRYNEWQFVYSAIPPRPSPIWQPGLLPGGQPGGATGGTSRPGTFPGGASRPGMGGTPQRPARPPSSVPDR